MQNYIKNLKTHREIIEILDHQPFWYMEYNYAVRSMKTRIKLLTKCFFLVSVSVLIHFIGLGSGVAKFWERAAHFVYQCSLYIM